MPLIPDELIDEIQSRADIAELIARYLPLKRAGRHFKANCPFHKERTPSFMVNTDKQIFHCFGCGSGGNIFGFLMQHDRLTFPEAVRQLAEQVGVTLPAAGTGAGDDGRARLAALTDKVCGYFERWLAEPSGGQAARAYLERRGVSEPTRKRFRLGLAPSGWDHLLVAAKATGVTGADLEAAGLAIPGKHGHYDRFRGRLMFPIVDLRGRVVGFGGRSLDGHEPKYLNGPETPLYTKGRQLFGLSQAREAIVAAKTAVVVEGYFDCVVLSGAGVEHVVAPLGTAMTAEQARLLKRYAERIILAFDSDAAGEQATLRGIDLLVEAGLQVSVARMPAGADPDEVVRSRGRAGFEQLLGKSLGIFEFLVESALTRSPANTSEGKVRAAQFVLPTIAKVPDAMLRSEYVRRLAERLALDERAVAEELAKTEPRGAARVTATAAVRAPRMAAARGPERLLVALVVDDPSRWPYVRGRFAPQELNDPTLTRVLGVIAELSAGGRAATSAQIVARCSEEDGGAAVAELLALAQSVASKDEAVDDCLRRLGAEATKRELAALREHIRAAQGAHRDADVERLLREYQERLTETERPTASVAAGVKGG